MQSGERYAYGIMMLLVIAAVQKCSISNCMYDIGPCAFAPTWSRYLQFLKDADPLLASCFLNMNFPLPAFHRYMHRALCQALYAWVWVKGAGVLGAETTEQGWSRSGLLSKRLKGMGILRKLVTLEHFWSLFNDSKQVHRSSHGSPCFGLFCFPSPPPPPPLHERRSISFVSSLDNLRPLLYNSALHLLGPLHHNR